MNLKKEVLVNMKKNECHYEIEKCFQADKHELPHVQEFVQDTLQKYGCSVKVIMQINLVVEELFVNIAYYAYPNGVGTCRVSVDYDGEKKVMITLEDHGIPFNPLEKEDPDITLPADKREIGGLGIFMIKQIMDQVEYQYEEQKNRLKLTKILS